MLLDQLAQRVFVELMGCIGVCFPVRPKSFRSVGEQCWPMCLREQEWKGQQGDGEEKVYANYPQTVMQKIRTTWMRDIEDSYPCVMCAATKNPTSDPKMGPESGQKELKEVSKGQFANHPSLLRTNRL